MGAFDIALFRIKWFQAKSLKSVRQMGIANKLTIFRIALMPVFVIIFYIEGTWTYWATALIYALAGITDWLDGYLARKRDQVSSFGSFLDPVADKLIVIVALSLLIERSNLWLVTVPALVIILREIVVSALRQWMAQLRVADQLSVNTLGKWKTCIQITAIIILLLFDSNFNVYYSLGLFMLSIAALLAVWSMFNYFYLASKTLPGNQAESDD